MMLVRTNNIQSQGNVFMENKSIKGLFPMINNNRSNNFVNNKSFFLEVDQILSNKILPLKPLERLILLAYASKADIKGKVKVSHQEIANFTGVLRKNMPRYLEKFKKLKILTISRNYKRGKTSMESNTYTIHLNMIIALSVNKDGSISIEGCPQPEVTKIQKISSNNNQNMSEGVLTVRIGCPHSEEVKNITKDLNLNQKPIDIVQGQTLDDKKSDFGFDLFWSAYPRKEQKKRAYQIWIKNGLTAKAEKILMDIRDRRLRHDRWDDVAYIPLPTTYLNNESWEDEIIDKKQPKENMTNGQQGNGSYTEQLKRAVGIATGNQPVSNIQEYMARKMDKKY